MADTNVGKSESRCSWLKQVASTDIILMLYFLIS